MSADRVPDDVGLAREHLFAEAENGAAVRCPRHLEQPGCALEAFYAQAAPKRRPPSQIFHEARDCASKCHSLVGCQRGVKPQELRRRLVCGHSGGRASPPRRRGTPTRSLEYQLRR